MEDINISNISTFIRKHRVDISFISGSWTILEKMALLSRIDACVRWGERGIWIGHYQVFLPSLDSIFRREIADPVTVLLSTDWPRSTFYFPFKKNSSTEWTMVSRSANKSIRYCKLFLIVDNNWIDCRFFFDSLSLRENSNLSSLRLLVKVEHTWRGEEKKKGKKKYQHSLSNNCVNSNFYSTFSKRNLMNYNPAHNTSYANGQ